MATISGTRMAFLLATTLQDEKNGAARPNQAEQMTMSTIQAVIKLQAMNRRRRHEAEDVRGWGWGQDGRHGEMGMGARRMRMGHGHATTPARLRVFNAQMRWPGKKERRCKSKTPKGNLTRYELPGGPSVHSVMAKNTTRSGFPEGKRGALLHTTRFWRPGGVPFKGRQVTCNGKASESSTPKPVEIHMPTIGNVTLTRYPSLVARPW